ncbi:hypothetical protein [Corynebacterium sp. H130]|uniref:hypothetical protein n=1 Tax=Corynebacterium sp. H130 TaxID=3133444 RepID=UPI0030B59581
MSSRLFHPAELGDPYDIADQSTAMFGAGTCLFGFVFFNACADFTPADSIVSALTRFAGAACAIGIVLATQYALPKSMKQLKILIVIFGTVGALCQFMGINRLMQAQAEVSTFMGFHYLAQLFYTLCLSTFALCIFRHRYMPNWMAIALLFAELIWTVRYFSELNSPPLRCGSALWRGVLGFGQYLQRALVSFSQE